MNFLAALMILFAQSATTTALPYEFQWTNTDTDSRKGFTVSAEDIEAARSCSDVGVKLICTDDYNGFKELAVEQEAQRLDYVRQVAELRQTIGYLEAEIVAQKGELDRSKRILDNTEQLLKMEMDANASIRKAVKWQMARPVMESFAIGFVGGWAVSEYTNR